MDGCIYAIKRIKLNPKNKQLNKKITREVKLLSRLNHENVVRYYNSWIESATLNDSPRHSRLTPSETPSVQLTSTEDKTSSTDDVGFYIKVKFLLIRVFINNNKIKFL